MSKDMIKDFFCTYFSKSLLFFLINIYAIGLQAQIQNNALIYVGQNSLLYTTGDFTFGDNSQTLTNRGSNSTYGKLIYGVSATPVFSSTGSTLFVDGFASTKKSGYFELPTGQGTVFAPIGVTTATITNGVDAAFYEGALTSTTYNTSTINQLPTAQYWVVKGDNTKLTLKWSSDISSLTNSIANLTVVGLVGTTWQAIPSEVATGTLNSGSITTSSAVTLSGYTAFTFAERKISCAPLIAASGSTIYWSGSAWDNITGPTLADAVVLNGNYPSTGLSFECNSLNIGSNNITLTDGKTIEVVNAITGTGTITMSSTASILQRNDGSTITPTIALTKSSRANMRSFDYIYWGSPLNSNSFSQLAGAQAYASDNSASSGAANAFDLKYKYVSGGSPSVSGWQTLTSTERGKGFIMRIKNQAPYSASVPYVGHINLTFTGIANNGVVDVATSNIYASNPTTSRNNNLLANPYPSAIDADKFLEYNTNLDGVVYLWKAQTPNPGTAQAYVTADYIAYTRAGSTAYGSIGADDFDGKIATGQGFKVKDMSISGSGTATFNNCMRVASNNTQFMRTNNSALTSTIDRFKVNITDANGMGNQILIAYMPEASLSYDRMYDASLNSSSTVQMYSILDNDTKKLAINARPVFDVSDQVTVGYNIAANTSAALSINLAQKEGIFSEANRPIFLYDSVLNTYHNFNNGAYNFTATTQQDNVRFKIVYQSALGNDTFNDSSAIAILNQSVLQINASTEIVQVEVYDVMGRLILKKSPNNLDSSFVTPFNYAEGIYIVKIKLNNGAFASQKLINRK